MFPHQAVAGQWTANQIHDTVAAIARQPKYATSSRASIANRVAIAVFRWIRDVFEQIKAWPDTKYVLIVAAIAVILVVAVRIAIEARLEEHRSAGRGLRALDGGVRDYWALAAELDAAGKYLEACHAIYFAALGAMSRAGIVRFHASKTSGDYARELRTRASPQAAEFSQFARQFERCAYGWSAPTHDDYLGLARAADALAPRRVAA